MTTPDTTNTPRPAAPKLTPATILRLARRAVATSDERLSLELAAASDSGGKALEVLAESRFGNVRSTIASRADLRDDLAITLSEDDDPLVAVALIERAALPDEAWLNLIWHPSYAVREKIEQRADIPESVIRKALVEAIEDDRPDEMVLCCIAASASTPGVILHLLKDAPYWRVVERVCLNPNTGPETLRAVTDGDIVHAELQHVRQWVYVIEKAAQHPALARDDRIRLASHPEWIVREKIAKRADLEPGEMRTLAHDDSWKVCEKIALQPDLDADLTEALGRHRARQVRLAIASREELAKPAFHALADSLRHDSDALVRRQCAATLATAPRGAARPPSSRGLGR